nr:hypothetical protein [Tanacetum cinerariifolium]
VSSPFEESPVLGSPRADDHEHLELPEMLEDPYAPPSPDYVPGPEHADDEIVAEEQPYAKDASPTAKSPEYVLESNLDAHPEDDDDEDPKEDPLYAEDALPTAQSPEYVPESDLEAYPEEDDNEDPDEDPVDYPTDGGDDDDDEERSSEDDEDDDMDIEADEEEHPAPADSVVVALPAADHALYAEETKPFEIDELLAMSTPPSSPLSPFSLPSPRIPFLPLPPILSPPSPMLSSAPPPSPIHSLGYRAAMIRIRAEAASNSHSLPLPPPFILSLTRLDAPS